MPISAEEIVPRILERQYGQKLCDPQRNEVVFITYSTMQKCQMILQEFESRKETPRSMLLKGESKWFCQTCSVLKDDPSLGFSDQSQLEYNSTTAI